MLCLLLSKKQMESALHQKIKISAVISAHNEADQLADCLKTLSFVDEIVVLLDKCTDDTERIARLYTGQIFSGEWLTEGERRNDGINFCSGEWIFEIDADERVPENLASEIMAVIDKTTCDWHEIPVDNYIGDRLIRWGWGASFGKAAYPGLFRNGVKKWGLQRVHPALSWSGRKGPMLSCRLIHYVDKGLSDTLKRLDSYSTARAKDLRSSGKIGTTASNIRRFFSRFFKCFILRKGYREGGYGLVIAICAGLYPLLSHLKAKIEQDRQ